MKRYSHREAEMVPGIISGASLTQQQSAAHLNEACEVIEPSGLPEQTVRWTAPPPEPDPGDAENEWKQIAREAREAAMHDERSMPRVTVTRREAPASPPTSAPRRIPGRDRS